VEIPLFIRVCPTSEKFDIFVRRFNENWPRAAMYLIMSIVQFLSLIVASTSLIAVAVLLLLTSMCYGNDMGELVLKIGIAALKGQEFMGSSTLGGQGRNGVIH
jgi:hypothetical protein